MSTHNEVAHAWAHQTGRNRKGFNMFYEGPTIYSYGYHFAIARLCVAPATGERVVLFNGSSRSVSTSKHQSYVRRAIPDGWRVLVLPDVPSDHAEHDNNAIIRMRLATIHAQIIDENPRIAELWIKARSRKGEHAAAIEANVALANDLNRLWDLGLPEVLPPADIAAYSAEHKARLEAERRGRDARLEKERQERIARERIEIAEWIKGDRDYVGRTSIPFVRVKGGEVQTTWGVRVPLKAALAAYKLAAKCRARGQGFEPRKRHALGDFRLDHIAPDGTIRAGCHVLPFKVQHEAARLAGLA